jgi:hypothetical protein
MQCYFSVEKVSERKEWPKIRSERSSASYTNAWKKVLGRRSGLRPSIKELLERRFGAFRHKKCPCLYVYSELNEDNRYGSVGSHCQKMHKISKLCTGFCEMSMKNTSKLPDPTRWASVAILKQWGTEAWLAKRLIIRKSVREWNCRQENFVQKLSYTFFW